MPTLQEMTRELEQKRAELKKVFDDHKTTSGEYNMDAKTIQEVNERNAELDTATKAWEDARAAHEAAKALELQLERDAKTARPGIGRDEPPADTETRQKARKSLGQLFTETKVYQDWRTRFKQDKQVPQFDVNTPDVSLKTLLETDAGFDPFVPRIPRIVLFPTRRPLVADLIPTDETTSHAIKWMEETTFTNNAAMTAEGGTYGEAALEYTERTTPVEKVAVWLPVTDEQLADVPQLQGLINNRLVLMVALKEETQLLSGDGNSPNLTGFYNKAGVQTQALGGDSTPDAFYKAITLVRWTGFADPTGIIMHPNDWMAVRLLKSTTGEYIWGSPAEQGNERMWGLPVVPTTAATENTGLVGDFQMYSHISRRLGLAFKISDSHSDFFINGKLAIRAEERLSLEIYRPQAFCTVTGI